MRVGQRPAVVLTKMTRKRPILKAWSLVLCRSHHRSFSTAYQQASAQVPAGSNDDEQWCPDVSSRRHVGRQKGGSKRPLLHREMIIERFDSKGKGIAKIDHQREVLIDGGLPGQKVIAYFKPKKSKGLSEATPIESMTATGRNIKKKQAVFHDVLSPSPKEIPAACSHFHHCGGCKFQSLEYEEQLRNKQLLVEEAFRTVAPRAVQGHRIRPILGCSENDLFRYRNKMEFSFSAHEWYSSAGGGHNRQIVAGDGTTSAQEFALGLFPPRSLTRSHSKVHNIKNCALHHAVGDNILQTVRRVAIREGLAPFNHNTHEGFLCSLMIRVGSVKSLAIDNRVCFSAGEATLKGSELGDHMISKSAEDDGEMTEVMVDIRTAYRDERALVPIVDALLAIFDKDGDWASQKCKVRSIVNNIDAQAKRFQGSKSMVRGKVEAKVTEDIFSKSPERFASRTEEVVATPASGDEEIVLWGRDYIYDTLYGKVFRLSSKSFFQPNRLQSSRLYRFIHEACRNFTGTVSAGEARRVDVASNTTIGKSFEEARKDTENAIPSKLVHDRKCSSHRATADNSANSELGEFLGSHPPLHKPVVWDLFCGVGSIGICVAPAAKRVLGVEIVPAAVEDARRNAMLNGVDNAEFICADLDRMKKGNAATKGNFLEELSESMRPDIVIVDPPRSGLHPQLVNLLLEISPRRIIYVSCNPQTQARDVSIFCGTTESLVGTQKGVEFLPETVKVFSGKETPLMPEAIYGSGLTRKRVTAPCKVGHYTVSYCQPVDMFPHTPHIESVCVLDIVHKMDRSDNK